MIPAAWSDPNSSLLAPGFPLPLDAAFTPDAAFRVGISRGHLAALVASGHVRRVFRGVYAAAQAPDSIRFRTDALALVVPRGAVITDRTAGWLHGVPILQRGAHVVAPPLDLCQLGDTRTVRPGVSGGRRLIIEDDIVGIGDLRVTSPVRTACDLGRRLWRFDALAALDGFLRIGTAHDDILALSERFKGFRGVRQLRALAPLADGRAESPGESALRLHWYDAGLPRPDLQHEVRDPSSGRVLFRLDVPDPEVRFVAEYDGEEHHSAPKDRAHDQERRQILEDQFAWRVLVCTKHDVYGQASGLIDRLSDGFDAARRSVSRWSP